MATHCNLEGSAAKGEKELSLELGLRPQGGPVGDGDTDSFD